MPSCWAFRIGWWWPSAASMPASSSTATVAPPRARSFLPTMRSRSSVRSWLLEQARIGVLSAAVLVAPAALADQQRDPELRDVIARAVAQAECFTDHYDSAVWYTLMEPRLRRTVKDGDERMEILKQVYCETHRSGESRLPPGLVMAVMEVESRFDRWAVSTSGAVGLMQVMPFWPEQLGIRRYELIHV